MSRLKPRPAKDRSNRNGGRLCRRRPCRRRGVPRCDRARRLDRAANRCWACAAYLGAGKGNSTQTRQSRARVDARRRARLPVTRRRSMPGTSKRLQQPRLETRQTLSCKRWSIRSCWRRIVLYDPNSSRIPWQLCRWPPPWNRYQLVSCGLADHSCGVGIPISLRTWIPP
jgi:hypothetical protein